MLGKVGVLVVNLGTPRSYRKADVFRYLNEFLTDGRVIDIPWPMRQLLVRGLIVPRRFRESAAIYRQVWTRDGSPLLIYGHKLQAALQEALGNGYSVELAMRYQQPSIKEALEALQQQRLSRLIILPLFPQYASATTGSVFQKVMECIKGWEVIPSLSFIQDYPTDPGFIDAFAAVGRRYHPERYDRILFSFHGLPERQVQKVDVSGKCLRSDSCCAGLCATNKNCYRAQCFATARSLAAQLELSSDDYQVCFQSRLGKDPWVQPYTEDCIRALAKDGARRILVFAPAFTADCLETSVEIGIEYAELFRELGGEELQLVESLNDNPVWVEALKQMILRELPVQPMLASAPLIAAPA